MKKELLEDLSRLLDREIRILKEAESQEGESPENEENSKSLDIRTLGDGKTLTIDFENVSIKFKKLNSEYDYWVVIEDRESKQLKNGDIVQFVKADDQDSEPASSLKVGKRVKMVIMRKTNIDYLSNPVKDWHT
jgi:hypothetical protein